MITDVILVNPLLPYEEQIYLLWRQFMRRGGWIFLNKSDELPEEHETVIFSDGDMDEWLVYVGYYNHETQTWEQQKEPYGRQSMKGVTAWMQIRSPEQFKPLEWFTGNLLLTGVTAHVRQVE